MWEPRRLTNLWASTSCYKDIFTPFYLSRCVYIIKHQATKTYEGVKVLARRTTSSQDRKKETNKIKKINKNKDDIRKHYFHIVLSSKIFLSHYLLRWNGFGFARQTERWRESGLNACRLLARLHLWTTRRGFTLTAQENRHQRLSRAELLFRFYIIDECKSK
jgi:hypothetical protein